VPAVGANTAQILAELGHSDAEIAGLRAAHVI
jgi:crotonobetainyl-CoA:carnitine CoA-transferase CaiB-like acyl-CoA transferase